jgi:hypothetical protein
MALERMDFSMKAIGDGRVWVVFCLLIPTLAWAGDDRYQPSGGRDMNVDNRKEQEARLDDLKKIADDQTRDGEERIDTILEMGSLNLTNTADYLLENISLSIPKTHFRGDDDEMKQHPCFYVLRSKGDAVAPHVFRFLEKGRNEADLRQVGKLLRTVMGTERARQLLEEKKHQTADNPESFASRTNIDRVLSVLSEEIKQPSIPRR